MRTHTVLRVALALAVLLAGAARSQAGVDRWTEAGPPGAPAELMAMSAADPLVLFAGVGCEIWRSGDGGDTWQRRGAIPDCPGGLTMLAAPRHGVLFAGAADPEHPLRDPALLRSLDGGRTWRRVLSALIGTVFVDPDDPSLVIAAGRGIFRSTNGGRRWRQVFPGQVPVPPGGFGIVAYTTSSVYPDPGDPSALYANVQEYITGSLSEFCVVSRDRGRSWVAPLESCQIAPFEWVPGFPVRLDLCKVVWPVSIECPADVFPPPETPVPGPSLIVVPSESPVLYASDPAGGQAFRSLDGGGSWSPVPGWTERLPGGPYGELYPPTVFVHPDAPERVFQISGGLHRATFVDAEPLLSHGGRIETRAAWRVPGGRLAAAHPVALGDQAGAFWFARPSNLEIGTKVIDGRAINGRFWAFVGALTGLEREVTVYDTATGRDATFLDRHRTVRSRVSTRALAAEPEPVAGEAGSSLGGSNAAAAGTCVADATTLCLRNGRFRVTVDWEVRGRSGNGRPLPLTGSVGGFWFFRPGNPEVFLKVLDGRRVNGRFWVFLGGLSSAGYAVEITDTETMITRRYESPEGELTSEADTDAFPAE